MGSSLHSGDDTLEPPGLSSSVNGHIGHSLEALPLSHRLIYAVGTRSLHPHIFSFDESNPTKLIHRESSLEWGVPLSRLALLPWNGRIAYAAIDWAHSRSSIRIVDPFADEEVARCVYPHTGAHGKTRVDGLEFVPQPNPHSAPLLVSSDRANVTILWNLSSMSTPLYSHLPNPPRSFAVKSVPEWGGDGGVLFLGGWHPQGVHEYDLHKCVLRRVYPIQHPNDTYGLVADPANTGLLFEINNSGAIVGWDHRSSRPQPGTQVKMGSCGRAIDLIPEAHLLVGADYFGGVGGFDCRHLGAGSLFSDPELFDPSLVTHTRSVPNHVGLDHFGPDLFVSTLHGEDPVRVWKPRKDNRKKCKIVASGFTEGMTSYLQHCSIVGNSTAGAEMAEYENELVEERMMFLVLKMTSSSEEDQVVPFVTIRLHGLDLVGFRAIVVFDEQ